MPQLSQSGRVVTLVVVSQGNVFTANPGDTVWTAATNNTGSNPPLAFTGILYSTQLNQKTYFADGSNWIFYDASDNSVNRWSPSAGTLPIDSDGNLPRLICTWRGRIVLAGWLSDPQNWAMSAVDDATNWDFAPVPITVTQAVIGTAAPQGLVGDVVTSLVPYSDDVLILGGDHTLWMFSGDPMDGGKIDRISDSIGMAWGIPWCKDPYGNVFFVSNRMGIYSFLPGSGQVPIRISQPIEPLLDNVDTGDTAIRLMWDDNFQGLHVFMTPTAAPAAATHFFFEQRAGAWWVDTFANNNMNPLGCVVLDGNTPGDRVALISSWDGFVRAISPTAVDDDGTPIQSSVTLGPVLTPDLDDVLLKDVQGVLGSSSGSVQYGVYVGTTAEIALASSAVQTGTWTAGRNATTYIRRAAHAIYVTISATAAWSMEAVRLRIESQGKVRRRSPN